MKVGLQFPSLRKKPVIIRAFFALCGPVTNTLPLLFREQFAPRNCEVFLFVAGSQTQSFLLFFFSALFGLIVHIYHH